MSHRVPLGIFQEKENQFTCECGLNYFKVRLVKGSVKTYCYLECPACGTIIQEDVQQWLLKS